MFECSYARFESMLPLRVFRCIKFYLRYQEINVFRLYPRVRCLIECVTCWQQLPWRREVWMETEKQMKEEKCFVSLSRWLFGAHCVFWEQHGSGVIDRDMIAAVNKRCCMYTERWAWNDFLKTINHNSQRKLDALNLIWIGLPLDILWCNVSFPVIKSDLDINNKVTKGICSASSCLKLLIDGALLFLMSSWFAFVEGFLIIYQHYIIKPIICAVQR